MSDKLCDVVPATRSLKSEEIEFLTIKEAAEYLRISEQSLRNMSSNGRIPYYKLGSRNRYRLEDLKELLLKTKRGGFSGY